MFELSENCPVGSQLSRTLWGPIRAYTLDIVQLCLFVPDTVELCLSAPNIVELCSSAPNIGEVSLRTRNTNKLCLRTPNIVVPCFMQLKYVYGIRNSTVFGTLGHRKLCSVVSNTVQLCSVHSNTVQLCLVVSDTVQLCLVHSNTDKLSSVYWNTVKLRLRGELVQTNTVLNYVQGVSSDGPP